MPLAIGEGFAASCAELVVLAVITGGDAIFIFGLKAGEVAVEDEIDHT